ncbi:glycoside hydrolase family 130 protein [Desulfothermus sp.]
MKKKYQLEIIKRHPLNPIITREDVPYHCNTVFNAAACKFKEDYLLLLRIEDFEGKSHLTLARSHDGLDFKIDKKPWIVPSKDPYFEPYERFGVEDPRITQIDGKYYITYTAYGPYGVRIGIGVTEDFEKFERISLATDVDNKDGVLFPQKIKGKYVMITRPAGRGGKMNLMWITYSPDLVHWGESRVLMFFSPGAWSAFKMGASTPPISTEKGWLVFFHGVKLAGGGLIYRVGAMLLDLDEPHKIIGYTPYYIFGPNEIYERVGDVPNVVFPCGTILEDDGELKIYYGAADTCIALATASIDELVESCIKTPREYKRP